jgi:hypothetical protein
MRTSDVKNELLQDQDFENLIKRLREAEKDFLRLQSDIMTEIQDVHVSFCQAIQQTEAEWDEKNMSRLWNILVELGCTKDEGIEFALFASRGNDGTPIIPSIHKLNTDNALVDLFVDSVFANLFSSGRVNLPLGATTNDRAASCYSIMSLSPVTIKQAETLQVEINSLNARVNLEIASHREVHFTTVTGAGMRHAMFEQLSPKIAIIEEAGEVLEPVMLSCLPHSIEQIIVIGDHQQIPPRVRNPVSKKFGLGKSLMSTMLGVGVTAVTLKVQNRMGPELSKHLRDIYPEYKDGPVALTRTIPDLFSLPIAFWENTEDEVVKQPTIINEQEVTMVMFLVVYAVRWGFPLKNIAILSYYLAQTALIKEICWKWDEEGLFFDGLHIGTIDSFQGEEREVVILSTVRCNEKKRVGFLNDEGRRCVAVSRAKRSMIILGNAETLSGSEGWHTYVTALGSAVSTILTVKCDKHRDISLEITNKITLDDVHDILMNGTCLCDHALGKACISAA